MIRTQVYLEEQLHQKLIDIARERGMAFAKVVRTLLKDGIEKSDGIDYSGKTALRNLIHLKGTGGPTDLSTNLDHYLYGAPKRTES